MLVEFVLCLDASDDFLMDRVIELPESLVQEHDYEPELFLRRLAAYRESNTWDETVVGYFIEQDMAPLHLGNPPGSPACCCSSARHRHVVEGGVSHPSRGHQQ